MRSWMLVPVVLSLPALGRAEPSFDLKCSNGDVSWQATGNPHRATLRLEDGSGFLPTATLSSEGGVRRIPGSIDTYWRFTENEYVYLLFAPKLESPNLYSLGIWKGYGTRYLVTLDCRGHPRPARE